MAKVCIKQIGERKEGIRVWADQEWVAAQAVQAVLQVDTAEADAPATEWVDVPARVRAVPEQEPADRRRADPEQVQGTRQQADLWAAWAARRQADREEEDQDRRQRPGDR
ncbi:MAG: hypothetical protein LUH19_03495 [Lachnospiraceae bacterium]|nr:hypothetical protein [Lachnospiraceae bacterium]